MSNGGSDHDHRWFRVWSNAAKQANKVGTTAIAVYVVLASHTNADGQCYPSAARLGKMLGIHKGTVVRAIRRLEAAGWVVADKSKGGSSKYELPPIGTGSASATHRCAGAPNR